MMRTGTRLSVTDPRGSSYTLYQCYDGLNRIVRKQTTSGCTGATLALYVYDAGTNGKGLLTEEIFTSNGVSGSYYYYHDARGQTTESTTTISGTPSNVVYSTNDAGMPVKLTYPDGDTLTAAYTPEGWPSSMTETLGTTTNTLVGGLTYTGAGGADGHPTSATIANSTVNASLTYDLLGRTTETKLTQVTSGTTIFDQSRTYDNIGNVIGVGTTIPAGTDTQTFCYDEQNRLTWAGATGTPPEQLQRILDTGESDGGGVHEQLQLRRAQSHHQRLQLCQHASGCGDEHDRRLQRGI